jgi:hypothetical protein
MAFDIDETIVDQHYEEEFEFPLWNLIKKCAEEKNISYSQASEIVIPEYVKTIRYGDEAYEDEVILAREDEMAAKRVRDQKAKEAQVGSK